MKKFIFLFLAILINCTIYAQIPNTISWQGILQDANGNNLNGTYNLTVKLYDAASNGSALWTETHNSVSISNGLANLSLGSVTPFNLNFDKQYWLEITVGNGTPMPRIALTTVPYSFYSAKSSGVIQNDSLVLKDAQGVTRIVMNPNTGTFKMMNNDIVWYEMSVNSPPESIEYMPDGSKTIRTPEGVKQYNSNSELIFERIIKSTGISDENKTIFDEKYYNNGNLTQKSTYEADLNSSSLSITNFSNGIPITEEIHNVYVEDPVYLKQSSYYSNGVLDKEITLTQNGIRTENTFDNGNLQKQIIEEGDDTENVTTVTFFKDGLEVLKEVIRTNKSSLTAITEEQYFVDGVLIKEIITNRNGEVIENIYENGVLKFSSSDYKGKKVVTSPDGLYQYYQELTSTGVSFGKIDDDKKVTITKSSNYYQIGVGDGTTNSAYIEFDQFGNLRLKSNTDSYVVTNGNSTVTGNQMVGGNSQINGILSTYSNSFFNGYTTINAPFTTNFDATIKGNLQLNGSETVNGNSLIKGNLQVNGNKQFLIDHPDDPYNKYLSHASIESDEVLNQYTGNTITDENGFATVTLADYVQKINVDFRYQLTVIGQFAQAIISKEINNNKFVIQTDKPNVKVSWLITAKRNDKYMQENPFEPVKLKDKKALNRIEYLKNNK